MAIINGITITGIDEYLSYKINNPILIKVSNDLQNIEYLKLYAINVNSYSNSSYNNRFEIKDVFLYPNSKNIIEFDLSNILKTIIFEPNGINALDIPLNNPYSVNNIQLTFIVKLRNNNSEISLWTNKNYINSRSLENKTNIPVSDLNLKNINIPYYFGDDFANQMSLYRNRIIFYNQQFYRADYYISSNENIDILNRIDLLNSDYTLFRFLNSNGGYNHILFETISEQINKEVDNSNVIKTIDYKSKTKKIYNIKNKNTLQYTVNTNLKDRFKDFAIEFISSDYVEVYNVSKGWNFEPIEIVSNSLNLENNSHIEFNYTFKLIN